ncbi:MAG: glutathione S-transferase N-terminal domain-containing protein, partial [Janthinobacterium lividum]
MTIVLHHYETSPFSELVRLALGLKNAEYWSVIIPPIAPKPLLTPLTGGYRKTPVLQVDADIYCDSAAAIEVIEALPGPSLFPQPLGR